MNPAIGILTVDAALTVRTWDDWVAGASGIPATVARGRPLAAVVPGLAERGLLARFEQVLASGEVQVLAPAFHHYLISCPPASPSPHFDRIEISRDQFLLAFEFFCDNLLKNR